MLRWLTAGSRTVLPCSRPSRTAGRHRGHHGRRRRGARSPSPRLRPRGADEVQAGRGRIPGRCPPRRTLSNSPVAIPRRQQRMAPSGGTSPADPVTDEAAYAAADDVNAGREITRNRALTRPRPGHADLVRDAVRLRRRPPDPLSAPPARETAARVAPRRGRCRFLEQAYGVARLAHRVDRPLLSPTMRPRTLTG